MKKIIKIALVAGLFVNIASANPIGRAVDKVVRQFTIKQIKALNQNAQGLTSNPFAKSKKYAESLLLDVWHAAVKKGITPSRQEFAELDNCLGLADHGILNAPGQGDHTLLKFVLEWPESPERTKFLRALYDRGAELNIRDKFVMGPEKLLKALVNVPMEASASRTLKAVNTLLAKNTEEKVWQRFNSFKMSGLQVHERLRKVKDVKDILPTIEKDLLAQRRIEQVEKRYNKIV